MLKPDQARSLARLFLRTFTQVEASGMENVPGTGAFILTLNHLGTLDVPLVGAHFMRNDAGFLAAKEHRRSPLNRWIIGSIGGIWVSRSHADPGALRAARDHLRKGYALGVPPEGTRSRTHALLEGKLGAAYLAMVTGAPVLPVAVTGTERAFYKIASFKKPHLTIRFGQLYTLPPVDRRDRKRMLRQNTDEIMCRIAALLPPKYRGVYADHPRLQELLAESPEQA